MYIFDLLAIEIKFLCPWEESQFAWDRSSNIKNAPPQQLKTAVFFIAIAELDYIGNGKPPRDKRELR